jgi:uncharacterized caspase-like protein
MSEDCAIVIGINEYSDLRSLKYARNDAADMVDYFRNDLGIEHIYHFSDDSAPHYATDGSIRQTRPTYTSLLSFLRDRFTRPFLEPSANLWFFFSGHGISWGSQDYLMPCDSNPRVPETAIAIPEVTKQLKQSGAGNVIMLLDCCRNDAESSKSALGRRSAWQKGVVTFFSCSPSEESYEIEELEHGAFTYALLEGLKISGDRNCATVERLSHHLRDQVPRVNERYKKRSQTPYAIVEPASKYHMILLPRQAYKQDIAALKLDALEAENEGDYELSRQLWQRVLAVQYDNQAIISIERIAFKLVDLKRSKPALDNTEVTGKNSNQEFNPDPEVEFEKASSTRTSKIPRIIVIFALSLFLFFAKGQLFVGEVIVLTDIASVEEWFNGHYSIGASIVYFTSFFSTVLWYFIVANIKIVRQKDAKCISLIWWEFMSLQVIAIWIAISFFNNSNDALIWLILFYIFDVGLIFWFTTATTSPGNLKFIPPLSVFLRRYI